MKQEHKGTLLALDQASQITGWAIFKNGNLKDSGIWKFREIGKQTNFSGLLDKINTAIKKYHVTEIVAEDIYKDEMKLKTFGVLAGCKAIVMAASQQNSIPMYLVQAHWVQKELIDIPAIRGKYTEEKKEKRRESQKKRMMEYIKSLGYTLNTDKDDESDAIGIGIYNLVKQRNHIAYTSSGNKIII